MYPPIHEKQPVSRSFDRLEMLWDRYPQYHEMITFSTMDALLQEHESWRKDFEDEALQEEYRTEKYDRFLIQLSWSDLPYRYATKELIEAAGGLPAGPDFSAVPDSNAVPDSCDEPGAIAAPDSCAEPGAFADPNPCVEAFLAQFEDLDTDRKACFLFPESFVSQFFVVSEVCRAADRFEPVRNLFPDETRTHYLAVFDKQNMDDVLLMFHLLYSNPAQDLFGGYSLYDYPFSWYQTHLQESGTVLRSPFLPDRIAKYQGNLPFHHNPAKTVYVRRSIRHILDCGYFRSELDFFLSLTLRIMPFFQWWYTDIALYEEKDGYKTDWRLARTRIRTRLTAEGVIRPKWKHELSLFHALRKKHPDTLYQYRPEWLGRQSLDLYIPSLRTAIEYQGIQHSAAVDFFGGEEALAHRQELDARKRQLCAENGVRLVEWPYTLDPTDRNVREALHTLPV